MMMQSFVHLYPHYLTVEIKEPLFEYPESDVVRINLSYVERAIAAFVLLVVISKHGEKVFLPKAVKRNGKRIRETFKFKDHPMTMIELEIPRSDKKPEDTWKY